MIRPALFLLPALLLLWPGAAIAEAPAAGQARATAQAPAPTDPRFVEGPCPFAVPAGAEARIRCGYVGVPEDRARPDGRQLRLAVAVLAPTGPDPRPDPVVRIPGGPGEAAVAGAPADLQRWPFLEDRALVLYDPRGTGHSDPRICPELSREWFVVTYGGGLSAEDRSARERAVLADCRAEIDEEGIDLARYTTRDNALDLDDIRRALGYEEWNLHGISYGTRVALEAARSTPAGIRSVILGAPYPPNAPSGQDEAVQKFLAAFRGRALLCAADPGCRQAFPDLEERFRTTFHALERDPLPIPTGGEAGLPDPLLLDGFGFAAAVSAHLSNRQRSAILPLLVHEISRGNGAALLPVAMGALAAAGGTSQWMGLSVTCFEDHHRSSRQAAPGSWADSLRGLGMFRDLSVCEEWHPHRAGPEAAEPVVSDIPTLILVGELDQVTPPRYAHLAAETLSRSRVVVVGGGGHESGMASPCVRTLVTAFLRDPGAPAEDACVPELPAIPFVLPSGGGSDLPTPPPNSPPAGQQARFTPTPCPFEADPSVLRSIDCGTVEVPEEWEAPGGRTLRIPVAVVRATSDSPRPDAMIRISGGPSPDLHNTPSVAGSPLRRDRDIVLFDFRGMVAGEAVCPEVGPAYLRAMTELTSSREFAWERRRIGEACRAWAHERGVPLSAYTIRSIARDVTAIVRALGYEAWSVDAISFGTAVAQEILRLDPPGLRAVVMRGPVALTAETVEEGGVARAFQLLAGYCARDTACTAHFPDPLAEYQALYEHVEAEPLPVVIPAGPDAPEIRGHLTALGLQIITTRMLYTRAGVAALPLTVRQAQEGQTEPLAATARRLAAGGEESTGARWAISCDYMGAWAAAPRPHTPPAFADYWREELGEWCLALGLSPAPAELRAAVESDVPTVILVGEHDPVTPPAYAPLVASRLRRATVIEIPGRGHEFPGSCTVPLLQRLFDDPDSPIDASCFRDLPVSPFVVPGPR